MNEIDDHFPTVITKIKTLLTHSSLYVYLNIFLYCFYLMSDKSFDPTVWGPHYWFFLMTIAISYPLKANELQKKNIMI